MEEQKKPRYYKPKKKSTTLLDPSRGFVYRHCIVTDVRADEEYPGHFLYTNTYAQTPKTARCDAFGNVVGQEPKFQVTNVPLPPQPPAISIVKEQIDIAPVRAGAADFDFDWIETVRKAAVEELAGDTLEYSASYKYVHMTEALLIWVRELAQTRGEARDIREVIKEEMEKGRKGELEVVKREMYRLSGAIVETMREFKNPEIDKLLKKFEYGDQRDFFFGGKNDHS